MGTGFEGIQSTDVFIGSSRTLKNFIFSQIFPVFCNLLFHAYNQVQNGQLAFLVFSKNASRH